MAEAEPDISGEAAALRETAAEGIGRATAALGEAEARADASAQARAAAEAVCESRRERIANLERRLGTVLDSAATLGSRTDARLQPAPVPSWGEQAPLQDSDVAKALKASKKLAAVTKGENEALKLQLARVARGKVAETSKEIVELKKHAAEHAAELAESQAETDRFRSRLDAVTAVVEATAQAKKPREDLVAAAKSTIEELHLSVDKAKAETATAKKRAKEAASERSALLKGSRDAEKQIALLIKKQGRLETHNSKLKRDSAESGDTAKRAKMDAAEMEVFVKQTVAQVRAAAPHTAPRAPPLTPAPEAAVPHRHDH